ncbi:MAG TPA: RodZ domain-containing protein [Methylomirabilota bacterium]
MSSLGLYLRGLREAKGMSLDDIARTTRVGRRHLEALESDTFGELPAPVFVKGFIHAYCEVLDSSSDEALGLYRETTGEPAAPQGPLRPLLAPRTRRAGPLAISIILFVALAARLFALRLGLQSSRKDTVAAPAKEEAPKATTSMPGSSTPKPGVDTPGAPSTAQTPVAPSAPAAVLAPSSSSAAPTTSASGSPAPAPPSPSAAGEPKSGNHHLIVRAIEPTWLRVQVDEGQVAEELLQAGAVREWTATRRFTLTLGNAGGVEIDLNGKRMPSLGAKGAVIQRLVLPQESAGAGS